MTAYCPERAAAHARKTVADEGRVEHDPRLVEAVARALFIREPTVFYDRVDGACEMAWQEAKELQTIEWDEAYSASLTALNEIARFEREEG